MLRPVPQEVRRATPALVAIIGVWAITAALWLQPGVRRPDGAAYFVYLPSTWLDHDLVFYDEWQRLGMIDHGILLYKNPTSNGHLGNHWTVGCSLLWYPAYVCADAARTTLLAHFPRNGVSLPYNAAAIVTSTVAGLVALLAGFTAARGRYGDAAATVAAIAVWLGSPLAWYSLRDGLTAHASSAAVSSIAVLLALRLRDRIDGERLFAFGLAMGVALAVRPQNAPLLIIPLFLVDQLRVLLRRAWIAIGGIIVGVLPQLTVSAFLDGNPLGFLMVGGSDPSRPWHAFERLWIWEPLLSWFHGMLPWTPFLAVAVAGFFFLLRDDRGLGLAAIYAFAAQWAINAVLERSFWGGFAFGQRRFDDCTIFFILGAAALFARTAPWLVAFLTALPCAWTLSLFGAASRLDLNRYYTPGELWRAQVDAMSRLDLLHPLAFVPPGLRSVVAVAVLPPLFAVALIAVMAIALHPRGLTVAAAGYVLGIALFYAWCGSHDAAHLAQYRDLIAYNRQLGPFAGGALNRLGLLETEEQYLRKSGREAEAAKTSAEIRSLQRMRMEALMRETTRR